MKRVVCNNTLQMARGENGHAVKVSHRTVFNERDMKAKLGVVAESQFESTMRELRQLAETTVKPADIIRDTINLFNPGTFDADGKPTVDRKKLEKIERSAPVQRIGQMALDGVDLIGAKMKGMSGTAYGWINAVTQYVDHEARARNPDNRMNSAFFGKGQDLKSKALQVALQHADGTVTYEEVAETVAEMAPTSFNTGLLGGDGGADFASLLQGPVRR